MSIRTQLIRFWDQVGYVERPLPYKSEFWNIAYRVSSIIRHIFDYFFSKANPTPKFPISKRAIELQADWQAHLGKRNHDRISCLTSNKNPKLVWDLAVQLGVEEYFATTGVLTSDFFLKFFQLLQKGDPTQDYSKLSVEEVARGIFISLVFGIYKTDIWVTDKGKIQFYNTTECFSSENYYCPLLDLPQSETPLVFGENFCLISRSHLCNSEAIERLDKLEAAIEQREVETAQDLVRTVYPNYRLNIARDLLLKNCKGVVVSCCKDRTMSFADFHKKIKECKAELEAQEAKRREEELKAQEAKRREEELKAQEAKRREEVLKAQEAKRKEEVLKAQEAKRREEVLKAQEAKRREEELKAQEAKRREEVLKAQEAKRREEELKAQEAKRREEELKAQEAKRREEVLKAQEAKRKEAALKAQEAKRREEELKAQEAKRKEAEVKMRIEGIQERAWIEGFRVEERPEERRVIEQNLGLAERNKIMAQARLYPIMAMALENVRNRIEVATLKKLAMVAQIIDGFHCKQPFLSLGLPKELHDFILKGKDANVRLILQSEIRKMVLEPTETYTIITRTVIEKLAELHRVMRDAKEWARRQVALTKCKDGANPVYALRSTYFKQSKIEKLMWDLAVIFGLERYFAATNTCYLKEQGDLTGGNRSEMHWAGNNLMRIVGCKKGIRGTIQTALQGKFYYDSKAATVTHAQLATGIFISLLFGMYDLHGTNIIVSPSGTIKFFDNTRCLPNGNDFIQQPPGVMFAYRSALLNFPKAQESLTTQVKTDLLNEVVRVKGKMKEVIAFFNWPGTKRLINSCPPGWFDPEGGYLTAMQERINRMESALLQNRVKSAEDLVMAAYPRYKIAIALVALYYSMGFTHDLLNSHTLSDYLENLMPVNLSLVKKWCDDPAISITQLLQKIEVTPLCVTVYDTSAKASIRMLWQDAVSEYKDAGRSYCESETRRINELALSSLPRMKVQSSPAVVTNLTMPLLIQPLSDGRKFLTYKKGGMIVNEPLDTSLFPGKVKLGDRIVSIKQLLNGSKV